MFFNASALLAKRLPALATVIAPCDEIIARATRDTPLTVQSVATQLQANPSQVAAVLNGLADAGILAREAVFVCESCQTLNGDGRSNCTFCDQLLGEASDTAYTRAQEVDNPHPSSAPTPVDENARPSATIGVITALDKEFAAVCDVLDLRQEWFASGSGAGQRYHYGTVAGASGTVHHVVASLLTTTGNNSASARASQLLNHFPGLPHIVMCGIAGGIPDPLDLQGDVRLGDVVISDAQGVVQYDFGKLHSDRFQVVSQPRPPSAQLVEGAQHLMTAALVGQYPWEAYASMSEQHHWSRRPADDAAAKPNEKVVYRIDPARRPRVAHVFRGPIASANVVLRDLDKRNALREQFGVRAVEMEGSGIAEATWQHEAGYLVIRGIVDFADGEKGDAWHGYGSYAAAAVLRSLFERTYRAPPHAS